MYPRNLCIFMDKYFHLKKKNMSQEKLRLSYYYIISANRLCEVKVRYSCKGISYL